MNPLDLHAATDATGVEECAYERAVDRISSVDGSALFESGAVDVDALLDAFNLPDVFDSRLAGDTWADMTPDEHYRWDMLAAVLRDFAFDRLDDEKAKLHASNLAA